MRCVFTWPGVADVELNDVHEVLKATNQFVWIGLHEPSEEVLSKVQLEFGLHDLAVEDAHNALQRPKIECISEETRPYFRDVYDHVVRINEMVENTRELLHTALEANFSLISISQNDVSKRFAGWAAIIAVPTMVAGFYGMNFKFVPESKWEYGFYTVILFTIASCLLLYFLLKRSGWL